MQVMRCELEMPAQFSSFDIERDNRVRVEIITLPVFAIGVRKRVTGRPEQQSCFRIIGAGQPGSSPSDLDRIPTPCLRPGLAPFRDGPESPRKLAGCRLIRGEE